MANPRKRKAIAGVTLAIGTMDNANIQEKIQNIATADGGLTRAGNDRQNAPIVYSHSALTALAADSNPDADGAGSVSPDVSVDNRHVLRFVPGEAGTLTLNTTHLPTTFTDQDMPHYIMADGSASTATWGRASGHL